MGLFIFVEHFTDYRSLILLIAAYLVIKGLFRLIAAFNVRFPRSPRVIAGSLISSGLGVLLWMQGGEISVQMVTIILCADLALRGWSLIVFALWLIESSRTEKAATGSS